MTSDRITLRLGTLAEPLQDAATTNGRSLSQEIRERLARSLRVKPPDLKPGNPNVAEQAREAAQARWAKQKNGDKE